MSDPRDVPPTPGTDSAGVRPHREDPDLWARHRRAGTHPYSVGEVIALIAATAARLARAGGTEPIRAFPEQLLAIFWHRLHRDLPGEDGRLADAERDGRRGATEGNIAVEDRERAERRARDLRARQKRIAKPPLLGPLTHPWMLMVCPLVVGLIEVLASDTSLEAALHIPIAFAIALAVAISVTLTLGAELVGGLLARAAGDSRRMTKVVVVSLLAVPVIAFGALTVPALVDSRTANIAYREGIGPAQAGGEAGGGFGNLEQLYGGAPKGKAGAKAPSTATAAKASGTSLKPDLSFFVPIAILGLAVSALVSFGVAGARDWRDLEAEIKETDSEAEDAREEEAEARLAINDAAAAEREAARPLAAYVEQEHGLLGEWLARFGAEYVARCADEGNEPRQIVAPEVPEPVEILERLLEPRRPAPGDEAPAGGGEQDAGETSSGGREDPPEARSSAPPPPPPPPPPPSPPRRRRRDGTPPGWEPPTGAEGEVA